MLYRLAVGSVLATLISLTVLAQGCNTTSAPVTAADAEVESGPVGSRGPELLPDGALPPPPPGSLEVSFGPVTVSAGTEKTQCVVKRLGNTGKIHVNRIQNRLGDSSHHLIVYRVADKEEKPTPYDCVPFADTLDPRKGSPLMVTQKAEEELALPRGVAFTMEPDQLVRLEMHYVNSTAAPKTLRSTSTFITLPDPDFRDEADFIFVGNPDIKIPPRSKFKLGPTYLPLPESHEGVHFFALTGHQHKMGINVTVDIATGKDAPVKSVYNVPDWLWNEPKTVFHDPPFDIPKGGGFRFTCEWDNTTNKQLNFGENADDEMCFFWAYYYPSRGSQVCAHTDQLKSGPVDLCCPGDPRCVFLQLAGQ